MRVQAAESESIPGVAGASMLLATVEDLESKGYRTAVLGGLEGRPEPIPVNGTFPDIRARKHDEVLLVVVESPETLHTPESERRWRAFGMSYLRFEVACGADLVAEARELAHRRGVRVHRYWVY